MADTADILARCRREVDTSSAEAGRNSAPANGGRIEIGVAANGVAANGAAVAGIWYPYSGWGIPYALNYGYYPYGYYPSYRYGFGYPYYWGWYPYCRWGYPYWYYPSYWYVYDDCSVSRKRFLHP